ncbi:MAG: hypothetical protein JO325_00410 [Solirubrobacterales bacterium]|nr:hypothetical protein [Solirubrobacterales bacterium]
MSAGKDGNPDAPRSAGHEPTGPAPDPTGPAPDPSGPAPDPASREEQGFWSAYWERFRCQQVDDPVEDRREGMWDRFRRQDVDAPVRGGRT